MNVYPRTTKRPREYLAVPRYFPLGWKQVLVTRSVCPWSSAIGSSRSTFQSNTFPSESPLAMCTTVLLFVVADVDDGGASPAIGCQEMPSTRE